MTLSLTFERRYREAHLLETGGELDAALIAFHQIFEPFEDPTERRVASADFCLAVELHKARLLVKLGRPEQALELLEVDWIWRLIAGADEDARQGFFALYGATRADAGGTAPLATPSELLARLERAAQGSHRVRVLAN